MFSLNSTRTRLCLIESQLQNFETQAQKYATHEDKQFKMLENSLNTLGEHIDFAQSENSRNLTGVKEEILRAMEREYVTKLSMEKSVTSMRKSMLLEISKEKSNASKEFRLLVVGFAAALTLAGWLYVNVVQKEGPAEPHATHLYNS